MNINGSIPQSFTRVLRGDNSTVLLSVNSGTGLENLLMPEPLGMMGLFDLLPLSLVTDSTVAEFMMGGGPPPRPPTSRNLLNNLPVCPVETKEGCPICQSDMEIGESAMVLPCNHRFHVDCVKPWLTDNNTCPTCRYELDTDDPAYNEQLRQRRAAGNGAAGAASSASAGASSAGGAATSVTAAATTTSTQAPAPSTQASVLTRVPTNIPEARPSPQPTPSTVQPTVTLVPLVAQSAQPRVRVVRVEPAPRPRPLVTVNLDPAVIAYSARSGIPLTQLVPLLLQRGGGQIRVQVDEGDTIMAPQNARNDGQLVRVQETSQRRQTASSNELDSVLEAAFSEFEQLERSNASRHTTRPNEPARNTTGVAQSPSPQPQPQRASPRPAPPAQSNRPTPAPTPDVNAMVTAAHLQALNNHSQLIQRYTDRQGDPAENHRLHSQTMAAHADLMAAHRQFMSHFCGQQRTEPRISQPPAEQQRPATLQDTMERNLRQYFGGQKKRKNTTRTDPESKARNTQTSASSQGSEC